MQTLDDRLRDALNTLAETGDPSNILPRVARRKTRRRVLRRGGAIALAVTVVAGTVGLSYGLARIFDRVSPRPVSLPRGREHIAFVGSGGRLQEIYVFSPSEITPVLLTKGLAASQPAWAPDGMRIAFTSKQQSALPDDFLGRLAILDLRDGRVTTLPGRTDTDPTWSADSRQLAFVRDVEEDCCGTPEEDNAEVFVANANGGGARNLTQNPSTDLQPIWSPDGRHLAFTSDRSGNLDIYVMRADGSALRQITRHPASDFDPAWSPDGRYLAFASNRRSPGIQQEWDINSDEAYADLYLLRVADQKLTRLTKDPAEDVQPTWSPDGSRLAFVSYRDAGLTDVHELLGIDSDIYVLNLSTGEVRRLRHPGKDSSPAWRPVPRPPS